MSKLPALRDLYDVLTMPRANPRTAWDLQVWAVSARLALRGILDPNGATMIAELARVKRQVEAVHKMSPEEKAKIAEAVKKNMEQAREAALAAAEARAKAQGGAN